MDEFDDKDNEPLIEKPKCPHCGREIDSWNDYWEFKCCKQGILPGHVRPNDDSGGYIPKQDGVFEIDSGDGGWE